MRGISIIKRPRQKWEKVFLFVSSQPGHNQQLHFFIWFLFLFLGDLRSSPQRSQKDKFVCFDWRTCPPCQSLFFYSLLAVKKILRPSDSVRKKIKNYAGVFNHIMWRNMLITWKTPWIVQEFKQFITLIIVSFHCFSVMQTASEVPSSLSSL